MVHTLRQYIRHFALSDVIIMRSIGTKRACRLLFTDNKPFAYLSNFCRDASFHADSLQLSIFFAIDSFCCRSIGIWVYFTYGHQFNFTLSRSTDDPDIGIVVTEFPDDLSAFCAGDTGVWTVAYQGLNYALTVHGHIHYGVSLCMTAGLKRDYFNIAAGKNLSVGSANGGAYFVIAVRSISVFAGFHGRFYKCLILFAELIKCCYFHFYILSI